MLDVVTRDRAKALGAILRKHHIEEYYVAPSLESEGADYYELKVFRCIIRRFKREGLIGRDLLAFSAAVIDAYYGYD